jgi:5-methylcytosine-specific restriction endonuclease McrA
MTPIRLCAEPRCPNPATTRGRCALHAAEHTKASRSPNNSFYASKPWRMARRKQLIDHPLCQYQDRHGQQCDRLADSVHHIVPIEHGGARRDPTNLMSLCRAHHSAIHRAMEGDGAAA